MADDVDCTDCVYGADFRDDGVPHRIITKMCERCREQGARALDFLIGARAAQRQGADRE